MNKDAYYFPHDSNARNDEKMLYIRSKHGATGYGIYWIIVEAMHESSDGKLTCNLIDGIAFSNNIDITLLKQFYNDAITAELFITDGVKYWSERVLRNKQGFEEKKAKKSESGKRGMQSRWGNHNTVITENNSVITKHNKGKERKGKETKEIKEIKEREINKSIYSDVVMLSPQEHSNLVEKFGEPGTSDRIESLALYIKSKGDKYDSHYATILNWERKNGTQQQSAPKSSNPFDEIGRERGYW